MNEQSGICYNARSTVNLEGLMSILFRNAKIIATENGSFKVLENAYLGVDGKFIDYIGTEKPRKDYDCFKDMYGKLLMPGLVNSHAHTAMNLLSGLGNDLPLMDWLHMLWPIEDKMRDEDFTSGMEMAILEMLAGGTTSFSDMYWRPMITQKVVGQSGIKADLTRVMMEGSGDYLTYPKRVESLQFFRDFDGAYDDRLHADWCVHAEYTIDPKFAERWAEEIQTLGGRLHIHLSETKSEHEQCIASKGKTPARWFYDLGFFNVPTYAAHCVWVSDEDIELMLEKGVTPVHNPTSNLKLGSGFAPIPKMLDKGLRVALGTDGSASNNNVNMFEEMHLASVIHNGYLNDPMVMKPETVLRMATVNGALAQGRPDTGSLEVGKKADIVALNLNAPHLVPDHDTLALVTYSAQASDVCMTMVDGKILYENGEFLTMDRDRIFHDYQKSVDYLFR